MKSSEDPIHMAILGYLNLKLPNAVIWHTPNGGQRTAKAGAKMKKLGAKAGMPDLFILQGKKLYAIEVKAEGKYMTPTQRDVKAELEGQGLSGYAVCRSIDDAMETLEGWGI